jgi:superfamily II DNA or RNA helicase
MRTQLKPHNKSAYQKVMKAFETSDRTCVVHPTGTGKSYIIAAVSESYNKVLILGPNNFVLDQVHDVLKWRKRGVEYMTYQTLTLTGNPDTDYDLICLDEFHRAGAPMWGVAVDELLEKNLQAKVLGTTATHIRFRNNERNMADELFHGNIASHITIAEAWTKFSILPIPRYVSGLFRWDKTVNEAVERIERSRNLSDEEKRLRIFRIKNTSLHWELSYGMPAILRKHLDKDARRIIIFCAHIESIEQMREEVTGWFREAGFTIASTCIMHSKLTDGDQRRQMQQFEDDTDKGVKLMFSVDMLNEGIHVPNVNAVLMLRTTSSRIIYMQQMGRCLTAANTAKPLVLDMVDNITTTTAIKDLLAEFDALEIPMAQSEGREPRKFEVNDYLLGVRDLIEKLVPEAYTIEERLQIINDFVEQYGRLPKNTEPEYKHWKYLIHYALDNPQVQALAERFRRQNRSDKEAAFRKFYEENNRFPKLTNSSDEEAWLHRWFAGQCKRYPENPFVQEMMAKEKGRIENEKEQKRRQCVEAVERKMAEGAKGASTMREFCWLSAHYPQHPDTLELRRKYVKTIQRERRRMTLEETRQAIRDFATKNDRWPSHVTKMSEEERHLSHRFSNHREKLLEDDDFRQLYEYYRDRDKPVFEEYYTTVIDFCHKYDQAPNPYSRKGIHAETEEEELKAFACWTWLKKNHPDDERVKAIQRDYSNRTLREQEIKHRVEKLTMFVTEKQRQPNTYYGEEENKLSTYLNSLRNPPYCERDDVKQLLALVDSVKPVCEDEDALLAEYIDFCESHKKIPSRFSKDPYEVELYKRTEKRKVLKKNPKYLEIRDRYKHRRMDKDEEKRIVTEHCENTGRQPSKGSCSPEVYRAWKNIKRFDKEFAAEIQKKYAVHGNWTDEDTDRYADQMIAFLRENNRRPNADKGETRLLNILSMLLRTKGDHPKVALIKELLGQLPPPVYSPKYFTDKQRNLRNNGKQKYGYVTVKDKGKDPSHRYVIYYTSDTRRNKIFEQSCKENELEIKEWKE